MIRNLVLCTMALLCVVFLLGSPVKANQHSVSTVKESIVKHSLELGIDPALALSIAKSESGFRHDARSAGGAVGVFQLMPSTAKRLGVNPYLVSDNIKGGLMYYKKLYNIFGSTELALAAYNAGPGVVKKCNNTVPKNKVTRHYVSTIMDEYNRQKRNPDPSIVKAVSKTTANANVNTNATVTKVKNISTNVSKVNAPAAKPATKTTSAPTPPATLPMQGVV